MTRVAAPRFRRAASDALHSGLPEIPGTRELLVQLLLGSDARARDSACALGERGAWPEVAECAAAWRVTPRVAEQITRLNAEVPEATAFELRRRVAAAYRHSALVASKGITAIHQLEARGIHVAAFKGLASMAQLHLGPKGRFMNDVDLLVGKSDLEAAVSCLEENGFRRETGEQLDAYATLVGHLPAFAGNQAIAMRGPCGSEIDLHWAVGKALDVAGLLSRAETAQLWDRRFPVVSMEDGAMLTLRHAVREDLQVEGACRDLIDTKVRLTHLAGTKRLGALAGAAAAAGLVPVLLAIATILEEYDPGLEITAQFGNVVSRRDRRLSTGLVELFRLQLRGGPLGKDLFYLAHQWPVRHIVSGLMADASGYRRLVREFEIHLIGRPLPWTRRLLTLAGSACRLGPRHLRSIRALAAVKYN